MESPLDTLAALTTALAKRVAELNWAGGEASLAEIADGLPDSEVMAIVGQLGTIYNVFGATVAGFSGVVAGRSARGVAEPLARRLGEKSAAAVVAARTGVPVTVAADWCGVGLALATRRTLAGQKLPCLHPKVSEALDRGELCVESARVILYALGEMAPRQSVEQLELRERFLVGEAPIVGVAGLRRLCRRMVDQVNPDGVLEREEDARVLNTARVMRRGEGRYRYIWDTDAEHHGIAQAATTALTSPRCSIRDDVDEGEGGADEAVDEAVADTRTYGQRLHDAIAGIFFASLRQNPGDMSGTAVTLLLTADHEAITTGIGTATILGVDEPISAGAARRLAAEAGIIPVIMGGKSVALDMGTTKRLFTEGQRYAMALRDGGCGWPTCPVPPNQCQAAHVHAWRDSKRTDLDNGLLFCEYHHRRFDLDGWEIEFREGVPFLIAPPHIDPARTPRRCQQRGIAPPG